MGFNTTVMVYDDALTNIENDPEFGRKLVEAIGTRQYLSAGVSDPLAGLVSSGGADAARVVETHHADATVVVAVGGNHATALGSVYGATDHHTPAARLRILEALADDVGMKLVKKPKKRPKKKPVAAAPAKAPAKAPKKKPAKRK